MLVADRVVRAGDPQEASGELAAALSVDRRRGLRVLPQAPVGSAPRRRARPRRSRWTISRRARSRSARSRSCSSSSTCCGRCSMRCSSPTESAKLPEGNLCPSLATSRGLPMRGIYKGGAPLFGYQGPRLMALSDDTVFELARRFRFQWEPAQAGYVLLYPEGMVKLPGSAGEIMKRVNGTLAACPRSSRIWSAHFPARTCARTSTEFLEHARMEKAGSDARDKPANTAALAARGDHLSSVRCTACSAPTPWTTRRYGPELSTEDWLRVLRQGREARRNPARLLRRRAAGARRPGDPRRRSAKPRLLLESDHLRRRTQRSSASRRSRKAGSITSSCPSRIRRAR